VEVEGGGGQHRMMISGFFAVLLMGTWSLETCRS
jgi:hypothetical protein